MKYYKDIPAPLKNSTVGSVMDKMNQICTLVACLSVMKI